jgi:outer membrane receptor protein involved in Fe transport
MTTSTALLAVSAILAVAQQDTSAVRDTVRMDALVVTGTRSSEMSRLDQATALSFVEPRLSDVSSGVQTANLLRDVAGVQVQTTSAGQGSVIIRGLIGNQVMLLVDGVPMNNGTYRDGPGQYLATIDPATIERIEVIRGAASVLYGSDAQGGVINVITKTHPFLGRRSVRLTGALSSADNSYRARVSGGAVLGAWSVALGGSLLSVGDLVPGGDLGAQDPTGFKTEGLDATVTFEPNSRHSVKGVVQYYGMHDVPRYDRYVTFRSPVPGRDAEHVFEPQARQLAFARYRYKPDGSAVTSLETTLSLAVQREGRNRIPLDDAGLPSETLTHWRDDVYTPGLSVVGLSTLMLGGDPVLVTWGGDYYHDEMSSNGFEEDLVSGEQTPLRRQTVTGAIPSGNFPDGAGADRLGLFLAADGGVTRWLRLSAGARWAGFRSEAEVGTQLGGHVVNTSSALTGQLGLLFIPATYWRVAARVAGGFRAPNLYDLTRAGPVPDGIALPNPDAVPERSLGGELALRYATSKAAFDLTGYYTRITNFIDRLPGEFQGDTLFNGERVYQGLNVGKAHVYGFEAEALALFGPFRARGTLLYTHGEQEMAAGVEEPMSKIPPLGGSVSLRWTPPRSNVWVEYLLRWATTQDRLGQRDLQDSRIPTGGTEGFAVHGVRAGAVVLQNLSVSAGFENIADALYRNHASGVDDAGRYVWVGASWITSF